MTAPKLDPIRHQPTVLVGRKKARKLDFPRDWRPHEVINPETGLPFSDAEAWDFVARSLAEGQELEEVVQEEPVGVKAYVMRAPHPDGMVYIKIRLGASHVLGRSFHHSET